MSQSSIPLTRPDGGGCYACRLNAICALRRGLERIVLKDNIDFFDVDERPPKWPWLFLVLAEACKRFEPREASGE